MLFDLLAKEQYILLKPCFTEIHRVIGTMVRIEYFNKSAVKMTAPGKLA